MTQFPKPVSLSRASQGAAALVIAATLAACGGLPERNATLDDARRGYQTLQSDGQVNTYAALELKQAGDALERAERAWRERDRLSEVDHLAYVANQRVGIARETARTKASEAAILTANQERDRVRLEARTREAQQATASARIAQQQAQSAQMQAQSAQQSAEASRREAIQAQQFAATQSQQARDAQLSAEAARQQAMDAEARTRALEAQLSELAAKKTERGMVITLGSDVLFDVNRTELKSGALRTLEKVSEFMKQYPERKLVVEGFTDSTGGESYNIELSERRAESVRAALVGMGVDGSRVIARGYGKGYPVATNDTPAGRQLNRRVEVIISNDAYDIAPRTASTSSGVAQVRRN
jgi:outer membrane protein OmpA-like peptidoglycan-associated protein